MSPISPIALTGILGLVAIAASWTLAGLLFRVDSAGSTGRRLALLLVIEGITLLTAGFPEMTSFMVGLDFAFWDGFYGEHQALATLESIVHHLGDAAMIALYPAFLAAALQTRLTQPFGTKRGRRIVTATAIALFFGTIVSPAIWNSSAGQMLLYMSVVVVMGFGLVVSIHAWRTAKPGIARDRARVFAIAFGIRDICWVMSYGVAFWAAWAGEMSVDSKVILLMKFPYALGTLLAIPLIAYGILQAHLFDIDLKIRWTIKQSTLAGIFVALMFFISEGASTFLSAELGNFAGLLAAAVLMFFLAPLQRFAERVASAAMPNTQNTPEYAVFRKMQVYEAAFAEAHHEDGISDRERALLVRLRDSLGISEADAAAIEAELQARNPSFA